MIYAGTGHRLEVLGGQGKEEETHEKVTRFAKKVIPSYNPTKMISGMAIGWDTAFALAALEHNIPLIAAVPFVGQESIWPQKAKDRYHDILKHCAEVVIVCEGGFASHKYHDRDKWMVANGDAMIALWNGHPKGGTAATVRYAKQAKKEIFNVWPGWENFEPVGYWTISDGTPPGKLLCLQCDQEVAEDTQYNLAEECSEIGFHCFGCGLFAHKAKLA